ncbi:hypothetical protein N658DRAFT_566671 [Parathielavia hyrcaniae]|uniref:DNA replication regulator Sld3 C-terminal domain-containing protein n=1 Tax=Parathielavia hyrcaniae TaxID=113614 RepID=A0AAN6Q157_9PEZI|nr:hypothetical protein N658DRAFT_566671 [Parathielavia hyrcaniae]
MSSLAGQRHSIGVSSRPDSRFDDRFGTRPSSRPSSRASFSARPASVSPATFNPADDAESHRTRPQSRQSSRDLAPTSPGSGKRKRGAPSTATLDSLLKAPVVLKPHPSSLTVKPRILHPLMLLPRESLSLSALDLRQPLGDFPASRLFESRIKILDLEGRLGSNIIVARSETTRTVYAVERESSGLYVLCKLGSWVDIEALSQSATVVCDERMRSLKTARPGNAAAAPLTTPSMYNETKRRKLAIEEIQSLVRRRSMSVVENDAPNQASSAVEERPLSRQDASQRVSPAQKPAEIPAATGPPTPAPLEATALGATINDDVLSQPTAEEIFQNLRAQYVEALYHSKGSLAYFAKGPLSRARAAFHIDWDANLDMTNLVEFLKSLVMTTIVIDKKYRETVPEIVAKIKTLTQDSETGAPKGRKRKQKKPKLGKDGLYPGEVDHIKRWWASHQPISSVDDEITFTATESRYHISSLRRRETQLQMILILEILALESVALPKDTECQLPGMESRAATEEASQEPSSKKRNKHNLPVLLDVHADRLCIWQSTTSDEAKAVAESQLPTEGAGAEPLERANSDPLRDFCVDIIVPFFSARLPGPCDSLNRKLGGPVAQSPPKERASKPASAAKPKPGAPIKRAAPSKRDRARTLERALSVERSRRSVSQGPAAAIALLRSATQTVIPGLKRETSDSSLMGLIPRADSKSLRERPSSIFSRSISLGGADMKAQKKAQVDAELKDAISALKKPNRTLAVKDIVEAADKRASAGQLRKLMKPNRASAVQVKATPANNRYKDALAAENAQSQPTPFLDIPPSSASVVPASTLPRKFANRLANPSPPALRVQATPLRKTSMAPTTAATYQQETLQNSPGVPLSSPIMARKAAPTTAFTPAQRQRQPRFSSQQNLPVPPPARRRGGGADMMMPTSPGLGTLFETPVAPRCCSVGGRSNVVVVDDTPIRSRLPLGVAGDGGNRVRAGMVAMKRAKEDDRKKVEEEEGGGEEGEHGRGERGSSSDGGVEKGGENGGDGVSIYQRLGWDTTDLDDIDDLL